MSFMSNYRAALKKLKEEEEKASSSGVSDKVYRGGKATMNTLPYHGEEKTMVQLPYRTSKKEESSFLDNYRKELSRLQEEKEKKSVSDKMTAGSLTSGQSKEEEKDGIFDGWFKKSESGIAKAILGTGSDILSDIGTGIGMFEKAIDAFANIAPYSLLNQNEFGYLDPNLAKKQQEIYQKATKESDEFVKKDLYNEEAVSKKILAGLGSASYLGNIAQNGGQVTAEDLALSREMTQSAQKYLDEEMEKDSVLDEKSDSLVQSAGQLLGTSALAAMGIPADVVIGLTSYGGEVENALNQDASHEEAGLSALVSAGAEILTEKFSGGIKFGGKTLDDFATKWLARNVSNKVGRTLAKMGMDMAGEGLEEVLSGIMSAVGQNMTYMEEKELRELFTSDDAWESFIGGAALGAGGSAIQTVNSAANGRDAVTDLTKNEQKVIDKVFKDEIAKAEKKGKLTEKQKAKLYDELLEDMEKGYISTDTIEEALGGEKYEQYKKASEWETSLQQEFDDLGKKENPTLADQRRYSDLDSQLRNVKATSNLGQMKARLQKDVYEMTKGDRLVESYFENVRSKQKYEADLTKYEGKARDIIKQVMDSGLADNSNQTHEFWDMAAKMSADRDTTISIATQDEILKMVKEEYEAEGKTFDASKFKGVTIDGYASKNGIVLNAQTKRALNFVVGHEITHTLEKSNQYKDLQKILFDYAKDEYKTRYQKRAGQYENIYSEDGYKEKIDKEVAADMVGDILFSDKDFVKHLSTQNRNVFQKMWDEVKYLCKVATAGSKEARQLEKVKKAFEDAYREAGKEQGESKYSLSDSKIDETYFDAVVNRDWETAERLVEDAAKKAGYTRVVYHGTDARFTEFDTDEESTAREQHAWMADYPDGTIFLAEDYDVADGYGERVMNLLLDTSDIKVFEEPDMYAHRAMDDKYGYEVYNYPVIAVKGKDMTIYATLDNTLVKSADTVTYGDGGEIIPPSERFKHSNPDIRFSLSEAVEETKDLMALHNLTGEKLLKSLKMGGLPMPSVAIAKAKDGHGEFGEISLILPKETIDPKESRNNKLYSGDAWTPTYPSVEYKPNKNVLWDIDDKISALVPYEIQKELGSLMFDTDNASNYLSRYNGNMVEAYKQNDAMKYAYLKDTGSDISLPMKEEDLYHYGGHSNAAVRYFSGKLVNGLQTVNLYRNMSASEVLQEKALTEAVADAQNFDVLRTMEPGSDEYLEYERNPAFLAEEVSFRDIDNFLSAARKLFTNGIQQTVDRKAAKELIRDTVDQAAYENWLEKLFSGVVEKEGIRNNKDYYTPSGNRRSFEALHYEHNLENVIKAMREQGEKGIGNGFGGASIFGASTTEFSSIEEMKQSRDRLQKMSYDEYQELRKGFTDRFLELAMSLPNERNSFSATDSAAEVLTEAVAKYKTRSGIANYLRRELKGWATYSDQVVDDLIELVKDIRKMPTGYFEAKPQRAVGFDEVGAFVIPYDADVKLKQELLNRGYAIAEYDPKVEGDRQRVVNQFEEFKFSLSNVGEAHNEYGRWNVYSKYTAPVASVSEMESVAPVTEETTAPEVAISKTETPTEELFPDDLSPVQEELERLEAERDQVYSGMEIALETGSAAEVGQLAEEYDSITARIRELESGENQRADSLTDEDAPPEMEAPLSMRSENYDPFAGIGLHEISRSTRSYSDQNPGARHFFEEGALGFLYDVNNSTHGERWYNDQLYYDSGGEKGFGGTSRVTTDDIADLKDTYGYTWDELRKAAQRVADGDFRSVAAKRVEYLIHKRMMEGYTDVDGRPIPANQDYVTYLNETFANEQRQGGVFNLLQNADMYAPAEEVAPLKKPTPDTMTAPLYDSKDKTAVKGQQSMFEPPKPNPKVATVLTEATKEEKKNGFGMAAISQTVDKGMAVENLAYKTGNEELQGLYNSALSTNTESMAQYFMENGAEGVKALKEIVNEINKSGKRSEWENYMYHVHNIDRMTLDERFGVENKTVYGETITADVSRKKVAEYEANNPAFKQWAEDIYDNLRYMRNMLVEGNLASQETADLWEKMYPHYVPIRRVDSKGQNISVPLDTNKTGVNAPIRRATGGNSDMEPLLNTIAQRIEQTYRAVARNKFGIELKNTLKNTLGTAINSQKNIATPDEVIDTIDAQDDRLLKPGTQTSNPTFTVFENGERVEFEITEELFDALKPAGKILGHRFENSNNAAVRGVGKVLDIRRNLLTNWNTKFSLWRNPQKDAKEVLLNSQHPMKTYMNMFVPYSDNALIQILSNGKYAQEYHQNGGKSNTYYDRGKNEFAKEDGIAKKIVKNTVGIPFRAVNKLGEIIEEIPRLAEYTASRKEGRSIERSMVDAARVTTNFAAGGDTTKFLNSHGCTFLNASVQGASQHVRNFREAAHKEGIVGVTKTLGKYVLSGLPALIWNHLVWDDDEEYEELNDYVKENYIIISKTEDGKFIRIPKGRTEAVMNEAIQQVMNLATGNDEVDLATLNELFWNNIAPSNFLENNVIAPISQAWKNEAWYGDEIIPSRLQKLPTEEQFDESTDALSRWLGENFDPFGLGAYRINYLIDQYSGAVGDTFLPMMTPEAESGDNSALGNFIAPWKKELTTDMVLNNKNPGDFYGLKDELEKLSNSRNATEEDTLKSLYMDSVNWEMGDLYAQKREIQSGDLPDDEKYEAVREIQEQINALAKNAMEGYNNVSIEGLYSEVGDKRYNKDAESGKWYEIREKNADGTANFYYQKEQDVTKALGISPAEYWNNREEYNYAYDKPEQYALSQAVGGYESYRSYTSDLWDIKADKDKNGKSISGSRKEKVIDWLNEQDIDYYHKIILFKSEYNADDTYNMEIIDYLNSREDISYKQMESILKYLGFEVDSEGRISWD